MASRCFHCSFRGEQMAFQVVMSAVRSFLATFPIPDAGLLEVAISEAMTNALRVSDHQLIHFNLSLNALGLNIRIRDHGPGFDVKNELAKLTAWGEEPPDDTLFSESGRGLWIIHQVFDHVHYNEKGNEILLFKKV